MTKLKDWIDKVHQVDRGLAALLRGLIGIERDDEARQLRFVWHADFHKTAGGDREADIRNCLGPLKAYAIRHLTLRELAESDPMLDEALALGARVRIEDSPAGDAGD
jgi:hypothetical protein